MAHRAPFRGGVARDTTGHDPEQGRSIVGAHRAANRDRTALGMCHEKMAIKLLGFDRVKYDVLLRPSCLLLADLMCFNC